MSSITVSAGISLMERGLLPDVLIRMGIRRLCADRLRTESLKGSAAIDDFIAGMTDAHVAPVPEKANEQHYELPPEFFALVLGRYLKYSGCYFGSAADSRSDVHGMNNADPDMTLDEAEAVMLQLTCERAKITDGQEILELGCGWGSLTLWIAERFPASSIVAVSNSGPQREYILAQCSKRGLDNVDVMTADMNDFNIGRRFDRVVSVEMFEHMRNYSELLRRVAGWLRPEGRLFVHIFCHRQFTYPFEDEGEENWMGRNFFTGGIMPSADLLPRFDRDVRLEAQWLINGTHYARTAECWLSRLDSCSAEALAILEQAYGPDDAHRWLQRWRVFFMACAQLFGYREGSEWGVAHYCFALK